ncbi:MAG: hypothetical protein Q4C58_07235 [Eubacteriales bacterium]|nr:hypothetical protein [Eubacteriales bacterium]
MDSNFMIATLTAAAAVGVFAAVKNGRKKKTDWAAIQIVVEVFGAAQAKDWFEEKTGGETKGMRLLTAYLTPEILRELSVDREIPDPAHYLVLGVLDERNQVLDYQFVNFERLEEGFRKLLDDNGGRVVITY